MIDSMLLAMLGGKKPAPAPPMANMAAWFRKGTGITSVANAVSAWADQSGNSRTLSQPSAGAKPTLQVDGTILFDGTTDFMATATFTLNQPVSWYARISLPVAPGGGFNHYLFDGGSLNTADTFFQSTADRLPRTYAGNFGPVGSAVTLNTWTNLATVQNGVSSVVQVDGTSSSTGNMGASNPGGITVGAQALGGDSYLNVYIAEIIVYSAAHDATARGLVMDYLSTVI